MTAGIYIASKTKHAERWRAMRSAGVPIISTWIDEAGVGETDDFADLWSRCVAEASSCSALIVYREDGEDLKGGWVEVGVALASGVPVFGVGIDSFSVQHHPGILVFSDLSWAIETAQKVDAAAPTIPLGAYKHELLKIAAELGEADDPFAVWEVIDALKSNLEESFACHRQACGETKQLAKLVLEMAEAVDMAADDIGTGPRTAIVILREAVQLAEAAQAGKPIAGLDDFRWIDEPITVTGGDYQYDGQLLCSFPKELGGAVRYIVRDQNRRLFIHNAQQCGMESA
jgi:hypothetical protein